jgi:hypothetical protein
MKLNPHLTIALLTALISQASWALEPVNTTLIKPEGLELKIKPEQLARIKSISADLDVQIKNAFKGEEALQNEMQAELDKIVKMTDETAKMAAVTAYQNKYKSRYQAVLAKGKINLADVATRLNREVPEMEFTLNPNLTIKGNLKKISADKFSADAPTAKATIQSTTPQPAPAQTTTVKNLVTADYIIDKELGCGGGVGSEIAISGGYMTNKSIAIVAGDCNNRGSYNHTFEVLAGTKVNVKVTYDLTGYSTAMATSLVGLGFSRSEAGVSVRGLSGDGQRDHVIYDREYSSISCAAFAFTLWPNIETCEVLGGFIDANITRRGSYKIQAFTNTSQGALSGGSYAESRIKKLRVTLTTSPNR